jgi:hypothetical protein
MRTFLSSHGAYVCFWAAMALFWAVVHVGSVVWLARQIQGK